MKKFLSLICTCIIILTLTTSINAASVMPSINMKVYRNGFSDKNDFVRTERVSSKAYTQDYFKVSNTGMIIDSIDSRAIIGSDNRYKVPNFSTHDNPYSGIVHIYRGNANNYATGFMISPNLVVTAAHVVLENVSQGIGEHLTLRAGVNETDYQSAPVMGISEIYIPENYAFAVGSVESAYDYAFIRLDRNYNDYGYFGLISGTSPRAFTNESSISVIGYPGDKSTGSMWESYGYLDFTVNSTTLRHKADSEGGNSGSPILDQYQTHVIGVHNGGNEKDSYNVGAVIPINVHEWLISKQLVS